MRLRNYSYNYKFPKLTFQNCNYNNIIYYYYYEKLYNTMRNVNTYYREENNK